MAALAARVKDRTDAELKRCSAQASAGTPQRGMCDQSDRLTWAPIRNCLRSRALRFRSTGSATGPLEDTESDSERVHRDYEHAQSGGKRAESDREWLHRDASTQRVVFMRADYVFYALGCDFYAL